MGDDEHYILRSERFPGVQVGELLDNVAWLHSCSGRRAGRLGAVDHEPAGQGGRAGRSSDSAGCALTVADTVAADHTMPGSVAVVGTDHFSHGMKHGIHGN